MRARALIAEIPKVNTLQDAFWVNWLIHLEDIAGSCFALCAVKRYKGDPRDVLHETMLIAHDRWPEFQRSRASFKTWAIWIARSYLSNLYATDKLPVMPSLDAISDDGAAVIEAIPDDAASVEWTVIANDRAKTLAGYVLGLNYTDAKIKVLRAMAQLIEDGERLSYRNIANIVGFSHTTVGKVIGEIRGDLEKLGVQSAESDVINGSMLWPDGHNV